MWTKGLVSWWILGGKKFETPQWDQHTKFNMVIMQCCEKVLADLIIKLILLLDKDNSSKLKMQFLHDDFIYWRKKAV